MTKESQPWSNRRPNGEEFPVFLACLPSMLSKFWWKKSGKFRAKGGIVPYKLDAKDQAQDKAKKAHLLPIDLGTDKLWLSEGWGHRVNQLRLSI